MNNSNRIGRKSFLNRIILGWFGLIVTPVIYVIVQYLIPPKMRDKAIEFFSAGTIGDFQSQKVKMVKFNKKPVMVVNSEQGQFKAFSAICTHLGCVVQFNATENNFKCNCHGSVFDLNGKNISGPAPKPLVPYRVNIKNTEILISES